jgi:twinkle protein
MPSAATEGGILKTFADFGIDIPSGAGPELDTTCPQCSAQRKKKRARCLSVNTDKGVWNCAHCGWTGGLAEGGRNNDLHWHKPPRRPDPKPLTDLPAKAVEWFAERGLAEKVLAENCVGYASAYMPQTEQHENCIVFEYTRDGEIINRKYRDSKKNFRMEAGCERILYGLDQMAEQTIICEGEIDALSLRSLGFAAVSVPDGAPTPETKNYSSKFAFLDEPKLDEVREWIIAVDADEPGQRLEDELARRLGREKCKRVVWPRGMKDANEVMATAGVDVLADCIARAEPYPIDGVFSVLDISSRIDQLYENGWERGVSTGWPSVDDYYTVRPGELTIVTGIPNSGKSNWVDALTINLARIHGWNFAVFSPENQPIEDHAARLMEMWAEEPFHDGPNDRMSREMLGQGKAWLGEHFSWILPDDDADWTVEAVLDAAKALVKRQGIRGLVIDPWNELEQNRADGMSETDYISHALKRCRQFARRMGVHVWMVAHPAKLRKDNDGTYPVPTLYDISGSAHWRNKADNGLCLWRDFGNHMAPVEVHVQKIRFKQIGSIGMAQLRYRKVTGRYLDAAAG